MSDWIDVGAVARILIGALVLGAGLPAVFALGLRAVASAERGSVPREGSAPLRSPAERGRLMLAALCFLVVIAAVALGIVIIVRG